MVLNAIHLQTLIASKAARSVDVAEGRVLVDFALRRAHGGEAGLKVARASYLAGFDATSNVLAGRAYGIPIAGTMAHSYVEAFDSELAAFRAFARSYPDDTILLVDTYDTLEGVRRAIVVAEELAASGHRLRGIRLDSGDVAALAREARSLLDAAGLTEVTIFASGGLDERDVARLVEEGVPIGGFGIGSKMGVAADSPFLDMAYKLVEVEGRPVSKLSTGKATLPGRKQVWRHRDGPEAVFDVVGLAGSAGLGDPLLVEVMREGETVWSEPLDASRDRAARERAALPARVRSLAAERFEVRLDEALVELADRLAARAGA
jgi:nicotinate phosphoribosyltransferase